MSDYLKQIRALYSCDYERRLKVCKFCKTEFSDITKRNSRNTCSNECDYASMAATRKAKGSYVQSDEQKQKKSQSLKRTHAAHDLFSAERRFQMSETMKKTWSEGKIDTNNHWMKKEENRRYLSEKNKGQQISDETRQKMSLSAQNRVRTKRETLYSSAKGGRRDDLGQYFRSNWEANFARILNLQGKTWVYEPTTFQLTETMSYTPDFLCDGVFYEIKGRMTERNQRQLQLMHELYSDIELVLVDSKRYNELRHEFKDLLQNSWEGK